MSLSKMAPWTSATSQTVNWPAGVSTAQLYAVNLGTNSQNIIIDTDMFAEAGIELPRQDWTWDEFEQIAMELHDKLGIWGMGPRLGRRTDLGRRLSGQRAVALQRGRYSAGLPEDEDQYFVDHLNMALRLQEAGAITPYEVELAEYDNTGVEIQSDRDR